MSDGVIGRVIRYLRWVPQSWGFLLLSFSIQSMRAFALLVLLLSLGTTGKVSAQTGALTGIVIDSLTQKPIPGVDIVIRLRGALCGHETTNTAGSFSVTTLLPEQYTVEVVNVAYYKRIVSGVTVEPDKTTSLNVFLSEVPELRETHWLRKPILDPGEFRGGTTTINRDPNSAIRIR